MMPTNTMNCAVCGGPLDWKGRCALCVAFGRLRQVMQAKGIGHRLTTPKQEAARRKWQGASGVDAALPPSDKD